MAEDSYSATAKRPVVGSWWVWELSESSGELFRVVSVRWSGEEWWVESISTGEMRGLRPRTAWNDLSRFWEAVTPVGRPQTRNGPPRADECALEWYGLEEDEDGPA